MKSAWLALGALGYLALPLAFFLACLEPTTPAIRGLSDAGAPSSGAGSGGSAGASGAGGAGGAPADACERARAAGPSVGLPKTPWHCALESTYVHDGCATCYVMVPPVAVPLASVAKLAPLVGGCHAEMVRSPVWAEQAAGIRRAALVVDGLTSGGVGAARSR
jgi:hypothetical protein